MLSLLLKVLCCLGRRKNAVSRRKGWCISKKKAGVSVMTDHRGWCISKKGWCVGCNPPFVFCGIRLIGLPAPPVDSSSATVCPFHLQDGRFIVPHWHTRHYACLIAKSGWTCRFCSVAKPLAFPKGCNSTCGRSFLRPFTF
jgi:hypothetical protein